MCPSAALAHEFVQGEDEAERSKIGIVDTRGNDNVQIFAHRCKQLHARRTMGTACSNTDAIEKDT
jgi:hypothetical protein